MTGQAEAEFHGGPLDGRLQAVERDMHGNLPQRLPVAAYDPKSDQHTRHQYRLRSDVGPLAAYDYEGEDGEGPATKTGPSTE